MESKNEIDSFSKMLLEAKNEAACEKIADLYSDGILEYKNFPDEYLDFIVSILSESNFYSKEGVFHFLATLGMETDIMSTTQLKSISDAITSNFINYDDEMLCLTACDFIARYYPNKEAKKILLRLKEIESDKTEKGFADDGLRTLKDYA